MLLVLDVLKLNVDVGCHANKMGVGLGVVTQDAHD